jgi:hypothetical protein
MSFSAAPVDRQKAQHSDEPLQKVVKEIRDLEVEVALDIRVIWENNGKSNLFIEHNLTVFELLQILIPGNEQSFIIEVPVLQKVTDACAIK